MAALQIHAEFGPTLLNNAEAMESAIERFCHEAGASVNLVTRMDASTAHHSVCSPPKAFRTLKTNRHKTEYASMQVLMSRPREEVGAQH